ncbi:MAG: hypothetical protein IJI01_02505 [Butyrivibrio sp.]|uniref:hypothetical protein n=1 Tax=Butyrivibrio sp. TaxID=28121 RepID=UPI0025C0BD8D|nr:hypothetical protein [Butyrivibrio sp.]MBQ6587532.1 hypothetical protein [Butyrivibrio sp.]
MFTGILCLILLLSMFSIGTVNAEAANDLNAAVQCSFVIPPEFVPGEEKGLFVNVNSPMESSTIKYSVYDNGQDRVLTNRERQELQESGAKLIEDESMNLTKEIYESQMSAAYAKEYGQDVGFTVDTFTNIKVDGYPGYKIETSYQAAEEEMVHQTVYIVLSKYRVFTIAYQRAEDDDCTEAFEASFETIHVR